jgi:hypothetical protein
MTRSFIADRDDLKRWENAAVVMALNLIKTSYTARRVDWIAPLDVAGLEKDLRQALSEAAFKAWDELDPTAEPDDRSDEKYEDWREARGSYLR